MTSELHKASDMHSVSGVKNGRTLCIMLSGTGRSLANLAEWIGDGRLDATISLVISSRECQGEALAASLGIPVLRMAGRINRNDLAATLRHFHVDVPVLAGYLNLLHIPTEYEGRILNIHPALLPDFGGLGMYGMHVHRAVLASGRSVSGCTVHVCDSEFDRGATILQRRCPVVPGDTAESLAARVFELETVALPTAIGEVLNSLNGA